MGGVRHGAGDGTERAEGKPWGAVLRATLHPLPPSRPGSCAVLQRGALRLAPAPPPCAGRVAHASPTLPSTAGVEDGVHSRVHEAIG
eukprot:CAMPEP_0198420520 /NCGR_PEP_ID=MMETSP1452-20131203/966_1 /TAXON_ID=1181717 /ORGANISM="Synchroma pusillum, Strain CCMP3072" /LENGTH=86 /DNA_ID=CAMNT_0044140683 /DNA_START=36 /DNA_END=293 /DNA_ORIENTATION=+